jgi:hypothetical protein
LFAQGEHDNWEQNKITGNEKRLKIKIKIKIKSKIKKENKKTKSKKSQVPTFSMQGMDKNSEARKENLYTHFFCVSTSALLMLLLSILRFHLPSIWLIS